MRVIFPAAIVVLFSLEGCTTPLESLSPQFGEAVERNMAAQIINPEGSRVAELPSHDGARVIRAQDRLMKEEPDQKSMTVPVFMLGASGGK